MTISEIKKEILERVNEVDDNLILEEVYRILLIPIAHKEKFILDQKQMEIINSSDLEIEKGNFITDEQSEKDLDEWLK